MPLKLVPPRKSPNWSIRGTYLKVYVDRSSGTDREAVARKRMRELEGRIERGEYPEKRPDPAAPTFLSAAIAYMRAGRCRLYLAPLIQHFGETPLSEIDQAAIDAAAITLFPHTSPATRNRKVYTPVSAVMRHAGIDFKLRRPKGAKGRVVTDFLTPEDAALIINAAEAQDPRFALLLKFLLYTGVRIGEAIELRWGHVDLDQRLAYFGTTKNGDPRTTLLREDLRDALRAYGGETAEDKVFPIHRGGGLKDRLTRAKLAACGVAIPKRNRAGSRKAPPHRLAWVNFHTFRHTWATWMRRYSGIDLQGLVGTGNWRDSRSAARYAHVVARDEWQRVAQLPSVENPGNAVTAAAKSLKIR